MTRRRVAAVMVAAAISGCGPATAPLRSSSPATPTPATTPAPSATPSASAVASLPPTPTSPPPPFTFSVPNGWQVTESDPYQVQLALPESTDSASQIRLAVDPASEDVASARRTTVAGRVAYVLSDGLSADGSTYRRDVLIATAHGYDELTCTGYGAYDRATLLSGCDAFTQSLVING